MTKKNSNRFTVGNIEVKVGENDNFAEERNYYGDDGKLLRTEAETGNNAIIETVYEYDEKGLNTKITTTRKPKIAPTSGPKIRLIIPKGAKREQNPSIVVELFYDEEGRIVEVSKNGVLAEKFSYTKTGKVTHEKYEDNNQGVIITKETTDKDGSLVKASTTVNGFEIAKFSKTCIRGIYTVVNEQNDEQGIVIQKTKYRVVDDNECVISSSEIESAPGYRRSKEIMNIRYNDNNEIEYMKVKEVINGTVNIQEQKCKYKNGKLYSIVDESGHELLSKYNSNRYEVIRSTPTNLAGMLNHLYNYDINKSLKKAEYHFLGTTKEQSYNITHSTADEMVYSRDTAFTKEGESVRIDLHIKKDNMILDLLNNSGYGYIIVAHYLDDAGKVLGEVRHMSNEHIQFDKVFEYAISDYKDEIDKFINDMKVIVK